ncbi:MAG: hypothetical protein ABGX25_07520 [Nautiliaceae bacterium]
MCMPRIFGSKLVDGVREEKKKCKVKAQDKEKKKVIHQTKVDFE